MAVSNWQISKVGTSIENQEQGEEDKLSQEQDNDQLRWRMVDKRQALSFEDQVTYKVKLQS